jgi:hypothetical protein
VPPVAEPRQASADPVGKVCPNSSAHCHTVS